MAEKKSYKDYTGSDDHLGKIIDSLNSGQTKVITSRNVTGTIVPDEYGTPVFQPFLTEQEGGGSPRALTPAEIAQARYNPTTERTELTVPVSVAPYIDTSKIPGFPIETWPVQALGDGTYKLSSMNNSETGYANVAFQTDATGRAKTITEANPASFDTYDKGNFLSNFAGAVGDFASSDAAKLLALGAGAMTFGPSLLGETAAGGAAGSGAAPTIDSLASGFYGVPEGSAYVAPQVTNLGTVAGTTEGMLSGTGLTAGSTGTGLQATSAGNLASMGGGQGLVSNATTANLAAMGGGQGLTTAGALTAAGAPLTASTLGAGGTALSGLTSGLATDATANAALGAGGAGVTANTLAGNLGTSAAATGTGSLLGTGAASSPAAAIAAAPTGTNISSLLTPTNALLAKGVLDTISGNQLSGAISDSAATQQRAYEASKGTLGDIANYVRQVQSPYQSIGANAANNLGALGTGSYQMYDASGNPTTTGTGSGYFQKQFDASDLAKGLAPNYDFMLQQGQMANQRAANVGGGALSGNTLTGLNRYTQDYAGNAYQNAFNNYQNQRQNIFGNLSNLAGVGQTSTGQLTGAAGNYGTNLTNLNVGNAAAQAAAQVANAQAQGNTLSNLGNTAFLATLLNQKPAVA